LHNAEETTLTNAERATEILKRAGHLIEHCCCLDHEAVDDENVPVSWDDPAAARWDITGAVLHAARDVERNQVRRHDSQSIAFRALAVIISARCGTEAEPFWTPSHFSQWKKASQKEAVAVIKAAAELAAKPFRRWEGPFTPGWAQTVLEEARRGE
jgi:hypothetical protein